jgi:hypothetical protein
MLQTLLIILLVLLILGFWPAWPYAAGWGLGYWPSGIGLLILLLVIIVLLTGGFHGRHHTV